MSLRGAAPPITLSALRAGWHDEPLRASMCMRIPRQLTRPGSEDGAELVLFATAPNAFRDAAPSVLALLDLRSRLLTLDAHLQTPDLDEERAGLVRLLDEEGVLDRAVGILLDRGLLPEDGRLELVRLAALAGTSVSAAARALIASATNGPHSET